jgi:hypothetical protein
MLDQLAASPIMTLIGFIEADSGDFFYVDVRRIARSSHLTRRQRVQCITGAALASAAMPAFFQQVRINGITYYDGGVRQSVFADHTMNLAVQGLRQANGLPASELESSPQQRRKIEDLLAIYVLRNGPTSVRSDPSANEVLPVYGTALRAEAIVVNQLEVGSIAAMRLQYPHSTIAFRSADGWDQPWGGGSRVCERRDRSVMFDPDFMRCLMAFGTQRAQQPKPLRWTYLPPQPQPQPATPKPPAAEAPEAPPPGRPNN